MHEENNDINVLDWSPLIRNVLRVDNDRLGFETNGDDYPRYYLLLDGIHPKWTCLVIIITTPGDAKCVHYSMNQETTRKDVERMFDVLQARKPLSHGYMDEIIDAMFACTIMHVENEREDDLYGIVQRGT